MPTPAITTEPPAYVGPNKRRRQGIPAQYYHTEYFTKKIVQDYSNNSPIVGGITFVSIVIRQIEQQNVRSHRRWNISHFSASQFAHVLLLINYIRAGCSLAWYLHHLSAAIDPFLFSLPRNTHRTTVQVVADLAHQYARDDRK